MVSFVLIVSAEIKYWKIILQYGLHIFSMWFTYGSMEMGDDMNNTDYGTMILFKYYVRNNNITSN